MTIQEKIRDAILGISKTEIEKTAHCTVPVRLEDGKTLTDKKWRNMSAWAGCKREEVAVYIDDTVMASCKKGVVFTAETMWFEETLSIAKKEARKLFNPLRYDRVRDIHWDAQRSSYFRIRLEDTEVEVYAGIFAKFYAEALKLAVETAGTASVQKKAPSKKKEKPAAVSTPAEQMTLAEVNARIAALEGELAALRARADAERQRKEEAAARKAAEEAAAKKKAAEAAKPKAKAETEKEVFSEAEAEEGYYCPACLKVCKPMAGYIDHVCPYCGKVNRCADLRRNKITEEDRLNMIVEDLRLSIRIAKGEVSFEPWDTNVPWNNDYKTEELVAYGMDMLFTIMSEEGERAFREAYKLGNMEGAYRLALLHLTDWHREDSPVAEPDPVLGREAARAAAQKGHAGAIALCKVLKIPPEEKPAPTREQQQKLAEIKTKLREIRRQHGSLIDGLKEKYYFLKMMGNTDIKEHEPLFMEWLDLVQQGEQLDDPYCIRELYEVTWSLKEHGLDNKTYYTSRMAELGDGHAMVLTGDNLSVGKGCKEDKKAALYYYRVAADMDAAFGIAAMAKHYYDEKNKPGCLYWARKLVEYKFPAAYAYLAELSDDPEERAQAQAQAEAQIPGFRK